MFENLSRFFPVLDFILSPEYVIKIFWVKRRLSSKLITIVLVLLALYEMD